MQKYAVLIFVVLLAAAPYGTRAGPLQSALIQAEETVYGIIDGAIEKAGQVIAEAKDTATQFGEQLKEKVDEFVQKVEQDVTNFLENVDDKIDEIIGDVNDPNLSKCKKLGHVVRQTVMETVANVSRCVTDKVKAGEEYITNIHEISEEVASELKELKEEADKCVADVDGIKATAEAIFCINKVGTTAVWVSAKRIPEISANAAKLGLLVSTLHISLPYCASNNGLNTLLENSDYLLSGVKNCVKEVIQGEQKPEIPEHTEQPEVPEHTGHPEVPEHTEYPEVPEHTKQPEVPEYTEYPEIPESTDEVHFPEHTDYPEHTQQPEITEKPGFPELPEHTEQPEVSDKAEFPKLPELEHDDVDFSE